MKEETIALINYRLERAHETLEEARILLEQGHANTYVNRLYYACFYAVSALLLTKGFSSAKHSGIRSFFHQNFVKSGLVDQELGQLFDKLYDNRQKVIIPIYSDSIWTWSVIGMKRPRNSLRQ